MTDPTTLPHIFWSRVDRSAVDGCWPWMGGTNGEGRGRFRFNGRLQYAYRVAWELEHGEPIPDDLQACHHCDNPICVRPSHIFPGTAADNAADAAAKGRMRTTPRYGIDHHNVVHPDWLVRAVREAWAGGRLSQSQVAEQFGVDVSVVGTWVRGETRVEAGGPIVRLARGRRMGVPLAPHGTHAGYVRHRRHGEPACDECLMGERTHCAEQRAKRNAAKVRVQAQERAA